MKMPQVPIAILSEGPEDLARIDQINEAAFGRPDEAGLIRALRQSDAWVPELSLLAEAEGEAIGHILFSKIRIVGEESTWPSLALAPMAVLPDWQSKGVGSLLLKFGLELAFRQGFDSVIVLGHPEYYPRFGFAPASQWGIRCPFPAPDEAFMALELAEGGLSAKAGMVAYSAPFTEVG